MDPIIRYLQERRPDPRDNWLILDTSDQTAEETVAQVIEHWNQSASGTLS